MQFKGIFSSRTNYFSTLEMIASLAPSPFLSLSPMCSSSLRKRSMKCWCVSVCRSSLFGPHDSLTELIQEPPALRTPVHLHTSTMWTSSLGGLGSTSSITSCYRCCGFFFNFSFSSCSSSALFVSPPHSLPTPPPTPPPLLLLLLSFYCFFSFVFFSSFFFIVSLFSFLSSFISSCSPYFLPPA